ncbi:hypothetical protein N9V06_00575 [SAR86 cluster bacterium]|nr:hypothetical protein [SAR86 cluster bacterium]
MLNVLEKKDQSVLITDEKNITQKFFPKFDLNKSQQLLSMFNNIETSEGKKLYEVWSYENYFILPALQEWLYWNIFVGVVSHQKAINHIRGKKIKIISNEGWIIGRISRWNKALNKEHTIYEKFLYNFLADFFRKRFKPENTFLLNDDGFEGFRFQKFKKTFKSKNYKRTEKLSFSSFLRLFFDNSIFVQGRYETSLNKEKNFAIKEFPDEIMNFFSRDELIKLINQIDSRCSHIINEAKHLKKYFIKKNISKLVTIDQVEECLGLMLAFKCLNFEVVSIQHGPITHYHSGWIGYGIPRAFCNLVPDKLITWGKYWKEFLLKNSNKYHESNTLLGPHLNKNIDYRNFRRGRKLDSENLKILVPYEFLSDNIEVSKFLEEFIRLGWKVTVKLRPDGEKDYDFLSYSKIVQEKAEFKSVISDEELEVFDIIAFTQTVYALEMMYLNIPLWYLVTPFNFLEAISQDGLAHKIDLEELKTFDSDNLNKKYLIPMHNLDDYKNMFSDENILGFEKYL